MLPDPVDLRLLAVKIEAALGNAFLAELLQAGAVLRREDHGRRYRTLIVFEDTFIMEFIVHDKDLAQFEHKFADLR